MKRVRLNDEEKIKIITNYKKFTLKEISEQLNRPIMTIKNFYVRWEKRKYLANHKSKNLFKLRTLDIQIIKDYLLKNPYNNRQQIIHDLNLNVCLTTLTRFMRKNGTHYKVFQIKPKLSDSNIEKRLKFIEMYRNWSISDWEKVVFSDESSVEIGKNYKKKGWIPKGKIKFIQRKKKYCIHYFKVWSYITINGPGDLVFVEGKWNTENYINILRSNLQIKVKDQLGEEFSFLQDSDSTHVSKIAKKWFIENNIKLIEFPTCSPDLNPIENAWFIMKKKLSYYRNSKIDNIKDQAKLIWEKIDKDTCKKLIHSMPTRIKELEKNRGQITKY
jgi:hypothetical protein